MLTGRSALSNQQTEDKAIEFILQFEKDQGRDAQDVRRDKSCSGYDVKSDGRKIEVKAATESLGRPIPGYRFTGIPWNA